MTTLHNKFGARGMPLCWLAAFGLASSSLAQTPIYTYESDGVESGTSGIAVGGVGDLNHDGVEDFAVYGYLTSASHGTDFRVYSGSTGTPLMSLLLSDQPGGVFFMTFGPIDDVNGDGTDDILAAWPYFGDPAGPGSFHGLVYILSGTDLSVLLAVQGQTYVEILGTSACAVGDMDQDGVPDFAASGSTQASGTLGTFVRVFSGATGVLIREWLRPGLNPATSQIVGLGDIDSDNYPDLLLGSPSYATFGQGSDGIAWALSGRTGAVIYQVNGSPPAGNGPDFFAMDLAAIGDIDADGVTDFVASAPADDDLGNGAMWVFSGATGTLIHRIPGDDIFIGPGPQLSDWYVSAAGDVNGDGVPDFMGSHPGSPGSLGYTPGLVRVYSGADASLLMRLDGRREGNEWFGYTLSALDDVNGDGFADILVGIPHRVTGEYSQILPNLPLDGAAVVYSGTCLAPVPFCSGAPNSTGLAATLGSSGSLSLAANDLVLSVTGAVPNAFGLFFYGGGAVDMPLGDGRLCVGPGSQGLFRLPPALQIDGAGTASFPINFNGGLMGGGPGEVLATSSWNFQFWYRDPGGAGGGFNLSSALEAFICP